METPRRRDLLTTLALTATGLSAMVALYPFVVAMQPLDDGEARTVTFDVKTLMGIAPALVNVDQTPVLIFRRTPQELAGLSKGAPRDPLSANSRQPEWARNWHRSLQPQIMVCIARCTHGDCNVTRISAESDELLCPCCGSHYDLAGRVRTGPAPSNLRVPPHRFVSETEIEFAPATIKYDRLSALSRAGRV